MYGNQKGFLPGSFVGENEECDDNSRVLQTEQYKHCIAVSRIQ